jgi:hypothetical protein
LSSVWSKRFTTRLQVSYNNKGQNDNLDRIGGLSSTLPALNVYQRTQSAAGGTLTGNTLLGQTNGAASRSLTPAEKHTISFDANYSANGWGSHEIQAGTYLQPRLHTWTETYYSNNGFTTEDSVLINESNPALGYRPFHRQYVLGDASGNLQGVRTTDLIANDYAVYLQDRWAPSDRLSISPGLRVEWIAAKDKLFDLQTQASWNLAPRIGAAYVLTADQKHVVRASWGRQTDIPNASYFATAGTTTVGTRDEYDVNGDGIFELVQLTPASTTLSATQTRDPKRHQGYVDEWIVGYRTQLPGRVAVDASYVDRAYKDRPASVEINQIYQFDPSVGHVVWRGLVDPTQNSITLSTNNTWNWFVYHGLEFTVTKQTNALNFISTYTRVWDYLDGTWQPNDPASILQPDTFPNSGGIGTVRGGGTTSIGGDTRNRSWQKHQFRYGASWRAPWQLNLSALLTLQSGIPSGPLVTTLAAPDLSYGPATLRINGRTVTNPLSTTTRFAYATRADGQLWTPWLKALNARVGRTFKLAPGSSVDVSLDVLNITNSGAGQQFLGGNNITSINFGQIQNIQTPRAAQLSARLQF